MGRSPLEAPISIQNYVRGLRAFFAWLHREGYTEVHLLADLKPPRVPQKLTDILTEDEIRRILACFDPDTSTGCRERAIVVLLLDSGLRLSELTNLSLADTHIEQGYLKVMGKGSKERIVPIGVMTQKLLMRYVYRHRAKPARKEVSVGSLTQALLDLCLEMIRINPSGIVSLA